MPLTARLVCFTAIVATGGCNAILGLGDFEDAQPTGVGGETSQGGSGPGQGGGGSGAGNGGGAICEPGETEPCYTGPEGTVGQGTCVEGARTCAADGSGFGECQGDIVPAAEDDCATVEDENCDGQPNEGCPCIEGQPQDCYTGPVGTAGIGICKLGSQPCVGGMLGACTGDVVPQVETCSTPGDEDCDGEINEDGDGCACEPNETESCYGGPAGTAGVGACQGGTRQCNAEGTAWGPCTGEVLPSTEVCPAGPDEDCDGSSCGEVTWAKAAGGAVIETAVDVASDSAGNVYMTGNFNNAIDFGNGITLTAVSGNNEIFVVKYSPAGVAQWAKRYGGDSFSEAYAVAVTAAGDVVLAGSFSGTVDFGGGNLTSAGFNDAYVVRLSTAGNFVWAKKLGGSNPERAKEVTFTAAGDVALIGEYTGAPNFGGGALPNVPALSQGQFLVQLVGATGNHVWSRGMSPAANQFTTAGDIKSDAAGFLYAAGRFNGTLDVGCGSQNTTGADGWVAKFDSGGNCIWSKLASGADAAGIQSLDATSNSVWVSGSFTGNASVAGKPITSAGGNDVFLARLSPTTGNAFFAIAIGGVDGDTPGGVAAAPDDQVHVGGHFQGTIDIGGANHASAGSNDIFLARFNVTGDLVWSHSYGDADIQTMGGMARNAAFDLLAVGENQGTLTMGAFTLASAGGPDAWVAKIGH